MNEIPPPSTASFIMPFLLMLLGLMLFVTARNSTISTAFSYGDVVIPIGFYKMCSGTVVGFEAPNLYTVSLTCPTLSTPIVVELEDVALKPKPIK